MEKVITSIFGNITKFFMLIFALGAVLGFVCSNGIFTVNYNPDNAKETLLKAKDNFKRNGKALTSSFNHENSGRIERPNRPAKQEETPQTKWDFEVYKVKTGETLYDIGKNYDVHWKVLARINHIRNPENLLPNEKIYIPVKQIVYN